MSFALSFYKGKRVLVTGHTGFKGTWLCTFLVNHGAEVVGYSSFSKDQKRLFDYSGIKNDLYANIKGDVRDLNRLKKVFDEYRPEIVFHLAAQPIVRKSYLSPVQTFDANVMGTVNVLECIRTSDCVRSFLNITTDKVYKNKEWEWGYRENEELNGFDPYSNSKSCSELVTSSYKNSFFTERDIGISTARAGNVIGGGDFAPDRIIPDCIRSAMKGETIIIRNPFSTRPYQHVLDPVYAYMMIAAKQYTDRSYEGCYNVGPNDSNCILTLELVNIFTHKWNQAFHSDVVWEAVPDSGPHEAGFLKLDCSKLKYIYDWKPRWEIGEAVSRTIEWTKRWIERKDVRACMDLQIKAFLWE